MDQLKPTIIVIFVCFLLLGPNLLGQPKPKPKPKLGGYNTYVDTFISYAEQMAGKTESNYIGVEIKIKNNTHISNWTLRVRTLGNYINQTNPSAVVAPQYTSLQFSAVNQNSMVPVNTNPVQLNTSDVVLLSGALPLDPQTSGYSLQYKFDIIIQGGNHLLVDNGTYRTSLEFSLYDGNNQFLDSFVLNDVGFQFQTGGFQTSNTLILQNADLITFTFDDLSDYLNGLSIYKNNALKINYNGPYEVIVKSNSSQLTSTTTSNTIPVSLFKIEVSQTQESLPALVLSPAVPLTTNDPVIITNPHPWVNNNAYGEVEYNLRYFIPPTNAANVFGAPATYTTIIYFVVLPQ